MRLLLIRHLESEKNVRDSFSSDADDEPLTEAAKASLGAWTNSIKDWASCIGGKVARVHCTNSRRSLETGEAIASAFGVRAVGYAGLRSTRSGALAGIPRREAEKTHPEFVEQLGLYRVGLFNAYDFTVADGKEPKLDFERRVDVCIREILALDDEDVKLVVTHRAPITAALISMARKEYGYPTDFFGYVRLDLGHISFLEQSPTGHWQIRAVNLSVASFLERYSGSGH